MNWPRALKAYRYRHALTQAGLAEIVGVDPTTISRWERGRDEPQLGIQRRLRGLVFTPKTGVERSLRALIDTSNTIALLFDKRYRLLYSSARHRALLRLDASELYGKPFYKFQTQSHEAMLAAIGGPAGWWRNGIVSVEGTLLRKPFECARNPCAYAQSGMAWAIRDGLDDPLVLSITHEIPITEYAPRFAFTTRDDALI